MSRTKISQLESATEVTSSDLLHVVDIEDGEMALSGTNKKVTAQILANDLAKIVNDGAIITANTSTDAVRITQTGSGNALVVEDSTNPDATPFVIDSSGKVGINVDSPQVSLHISDSGEGFDNSFLSPDFVDAVVVSGQEEATSFNVSVASSSAIKRGVFKGTRSRGTLLSPTAPLINDETVSLLGAVHDGTKSMATASVDAIVDGTVSEDIAPQAIRFRTGDTTRVERMRIDSSGNVGIGTTSPTARLNVVTDTSSDAVRITQTGSGNALVVEDSANPDATPFVISNSGNIGIGTSFPAGALAIERDDSTNLITYRSSDDAIGSYWQLRKARGDSSSRAIVNDDDGIGGIAFYGFDGSGSVAASQIASFIDGTPGSSDMPGRIIFGTTSSGNSTPTERMRIDSSGNVGIGTTSPSSKLHVAGDLTLSSATTANSATAGSNGDVPAQVSGYLQVNLNGTNVKIPYYAV